MLGGIIGKGAFGEVCSASLSREKDVSKVMGDIKLPMFQGNTDANNPVSPDLVKLT